jgi:hypothetical protein
MRPAAYAGAAAAVCVRMRDDLEFLVLGDAKSRDEKAQRNGCKFSVLFGSEIRF